MASISPNRQRPTTSHTDPGSVREGPPDARGPWRCGPCLGQPGPIPFPPSDAEPHAHTRCLWPYICFTVSLQNTPSPFLQAAVTSSDGRPNPPGPRPCARAAAAAAVCSPAAANLPVGFLSIQSVWRCKCTLALSLCRTPCKWAGPRTACLASAGVPLRLLGQHTFDLIGLVLILSYPVWSYGQCLRRWQSAASLATALLALPPITHNP